LETVLTGGIPDRVPYCEFEVSARHVNYVLGREINLKSTDLSPADYVEFTKRIGCDFLYYNYLWELGRVYQSDARGQRHYSGGSIKRASDLDKITRPDITAALKRIKKLAEYCETNNLGLILGFSPPYKTALHAVGHEDFFIKTCTEKRFILKLQEIIMHYASEILRDFLNYPISAFFVHGDVCYKTGPMLNPAMTRELWLESTKEFIKPVKKNGKPVILHMDGNFSPIIDMILEIEPDAIHPFEPCGRMDIYAFKRLYGKRITVIGNIDLTGALCFGTPAQVTEAVKTHIENLAPGGRYMCGSSHEITADVPLENFTALIESVSKFGKY